MRVISDWRYRKKEAIKKCHLCVPITHLTCGSMGRREMPSSPTFSPSVPETGGRTGPGVTRAGGLSLPLTSCSAPESAPVPHQGNTIELALVVQVRESPP